jgi:exodeoxyribonuclease V beta subunit
MKKHELPGPTAERHDFNFETIPLEGINLIEAGAGTGKTWSITGIYLRLLLEKKLSPDQILVVTFTDAATSELRERLRTRLAAALHIMREGTLPENADDIHQYCLRARTQESDPGQHMARLEQALAIFDEAPVHTIHGFCYRLIREHAFENSAPLSSELLTDVSELARISAFDFWRRHAFTASDELAEFLAADGLQPATIAELYRAWSSRLELDIRPGGVPDTDPEKHSKPCVPCTADSAPRTPAGGMISVIGWQRRL